MKTEESLRPGKKSFEQKLKTVFCSEREKKILPDASVGLCVERCMASAVIEAKDHAKKYNVPAVLVADAEAGYDYDLYCRDSDCKFIVINIHRAINLHTHNIAKNDLTADDSIQLFDMLSKSFDILKDDSHNMIMIHTKPHILAQLLHPAETKNSFNDYHSVVKALCLVNLSMRPFICFGPSIDEFDILNEIISYAQLINAPVGYCANSYNTQPYDHVLNFGALGQSYHAEKALEKADLILAIGSALPDLDENCVKDKKIIYISSEHQKHRHKGVELNGNIKEILNILLGLTLSKHCTQNKWIYDIKNAKYKNNTSLLSSSNYATAK